jgi:HSP20 family protein
MARLPILRKHNQQSTAVARRGANEAVPLRQMMSRLFDESFLMPSLFNEFFSTPLMGATTGSNVYETDDSYIVQFAMPGVKADSINCSIEGNVLTCSAPSALQAPEKTTTLWESIGGQNEYQVQLPSEAEANNAKATYENGIVTITLPKAAHAKAQKIQVSAK